MIIFFVICLVTTVIIYSLISATKVTKKNNSEILKIKKCNLLIKDYTTKKVHINVKMVKNILFGLKII